MRHIGSHYGISYSVKKTVFQNVFANLIIVLVLVLVGATTAVGGVFAVTADGTQQAHYRGDPATPKMSLMINVYWGTEYLPSMLDTLADRQVKCTFFIGGTWAASNNALLNRIKLEGHELGNHGYYHKDATTISAARNKEEILVTEKLVEGITGVKTRLFAPPSGAFDKNTLKVASEIGYHTIMWTQDTIDWRDHDVDLIYKRATTKAANGNLVLMHPTAATAKALPKIIDSLSAAGYTLTTVSDTLGKLISS